MGPAGSGVAMSSAKYASGRMTQLDGKATADEVVTVEDVKDAEKLARRLQKAYADIAELKRRWNPRRIYFYDVAVDNTGTTQYQFAHNFSSRVNWWAVDWQSTVVAGNQCTLERHSATTDNTLVLVSGIAGTVSLCVEEAG